MAHLVVGQAGTCPATTSEARGTREGRHSQRSVHIWTYITGAFTRFQNPKFRLHKLPLAFRLWTFIMKQCPSFISVLAMTDSVLCNKTPGYGLRRICAVARLTGMSRQHLRDPIRPKRLTPCLFSSDPAFREQHASCLPHLPNPALPASARVWALVWQ